MNIKIKNSYGINVKTIMQLIYHQGKLNFFNNFVELTTLQVCGIMQIQKAIIIALLYMYICSHLNLFFVYTFEFNYDSNDNDDILNI